MKMVKSLLLGSAAGLVAVAGAQAADLPVKAKPVEYVKICSLYGDGFYYIPGTDICLKVGGYIRAEYGWNTRGGAVPIYAGTQGRFTRADSEFSTRHRFNLSMDARSQTAYGTLRAFASVNFENLDEANATPGLTRAFIQWAGFTFGRTRSFTDHISVGEDIGSLFTTQNQADTGANGTNQIAYTWELGNGMTLNVGADERKVASLANLSGNAFTLPGVDPTSSRGGNFHPNPWVAFKVSQAWGRFSVAAVANDNNASYYTNTPGVTGYVPTVGCNQQSGTTFCDHPGNKWGWAVLVGGEIKTPFIAPKDSLYWYFNYAQGATRYGAGSNLTSPGLYGSGNELAVGAVTDGVFVNGTGIELTTSWTAGGGYLHWWTANFSSALYGTYTEVNYNNTVVDSGWFCGSGGAVNQGVRPASNLSCDPSFKYWTIGLVTSWYPVAGFRLAVDVLYQGIDTGFSGPISLNTANSPRPTGGYTAKNEQNVAVMFRAQRNFPSE